MTDDVPPALVRDLLAFIGRDGRPLAEVLEAWRTSCPRLPIWETALDGGLVTLIHDGDRGGMVRLTALGARRLAAGGDQ